MNGIILKGISGFYYVQTDESNYECRARGSFRKEGIIPLAGDRVTFSPLDAEHGVIEEILPRKNALRRPPVANIDKLFIVSSYSTPEPDTLAIDRMTAAAVYRGITPVIVFNKSDMGDFEELHKLYSDAGFHTYTVSALSGDGLDGIRGELSGYISAFAGNSGVGKSSILNALFGELGLKTGTVSEKLGRGRHTTRETELFPCFRGGYVADTPGFASFLPDNDDFDFKLKLPDCFPDFADFSTHCRYTSCTHICEKGCAVLDGVKSGKISGSRHKSYIEIFNELKNLKAWEASDYKK